KVIWEVCHGRLASSPASAGWLGFARKPRRGRRRPRGRPCANPRGLRANPSHPDPEGSRQGTARGEGDGLTPRRGRRPDGDTPNRIASVAPMARPPARSYIKRVMLYSTLVKRFFRALYGEPPDLSVDRPGWGLVLVADGVGGLDLCGTALRYVMGA